MVEGGGGGGRSQGGREETYESKPSGPETFSPISLPIYLDGTLISFLNCEDVGIVYAETRVGGEGGYKEGTD